MNNDDKTKKSDYNYEVSLYIIRGVLISVLVGTSVIASFKLGAKFGAIIAPSYPSYHFVFSIVWSLMVLLGIESVFGLTSSKVSTPGSNSKSTYFLLIVALGSSLYLSINNNQFVTGMIETTNFREYNEARRQKIKQDSINKNQAFHLIASAEKEEKELIDNDKTEADKLVKEAVRNVSKAWQNDYYNAPTYFRTCTTCPPNYKKWRDKVIAAEKKAKEIRNRNKGYAASIKSSLAPTLSYNVEQDSSLNIIYQNTLTINKQKEDQKDTTNNILLGILFCSAILSLLISYELKDHRTKNGHQVEEKVFVASIKYMIMIKNALSFSLSLATHLFVWIGTTIKERLNVQDVLGMISVQDTYGQLSVQTTQNGTDKKNSYPSDLRTDKASTHATVVSIPAKKTDNKKKKKEQSGTDRKCLVCETDISHKRSDAKFCSSKCRKEHHNFSLK